MAALPSSARFVSTFMTSTSHSGNASTPSLRSESFRSRASPPSGKRSAKSSPRSLLYSDAQLVELVGRPSKVEGFSTSEDHVTERSVRPRIARRQQSSVAARSSERFGRGILVVSEWRVDLAFDGVDESPAPGWVHDEQVAPTLRLDEEFRCSREGGIAREAADGLPEVFLQSPIMLPRKGDGRRREPFPLVAIAGPRWRGEEVSRLEILSAREQCKRDGTTLRSPCRPQGALQGDCQHVGESLPNVRPGGLDPQGLSSLDEKPFGLHDAKRDSGVSLARNWGRSRGSACAHRFGGDRRALRRYEVAA